MIYKILKPLCKASIYSFFRRVQIVGKENIPNKGPVIFVANHPSAFMDPIAVASLVKPPVFFMAAGEYVGTGIKGWMFEKAFHSIPVYRPSTRPEDVHKNKNMFEKCHTHLHNNGALLVFPEGVSKTELKLKPLKTGVARIAREAEIQKDFNLNLKIVPIGINYSDPHAFRSDLLFQVGKPIFVKEFITKNEDQEIEEVKNLTDLMQSKIQEMVLHVNEEDDEHLLKKINAIYSRDIKVELGIEESEQERSFDMQKEIIEAINFYKKKDPEKLNLIETEMDEYLSQLNSFGLNDHDILNLKIQPTFWRIFNLILGFPIFLLGFINNIIPYHLIRFTLKKLKVGGTFLGSMTMAIGLVIFLLWFTLACILLFIFSDLSLYVLFYPLIMYVSGIYALLYYQRFSYSQGRNKMRREFKKGKERLKDLIKLRKSLIESLEEARLYFEKSKTNN